MEYKILKGREREGILEIICERFGFDKKIFSQLELFQLSKGRVYCIKEGCLEHLKTKCVVTAGLLFARLGRSVKPSNNMVQIFGHLATKNTMSIEGEDAKSFIRGEDLDALDIHGKPVEKGYVIIKYLDYPLGVGLYKDGKVKNMLPKGRRLEAKIGKLS